MSLRPRSDPEPQPRLDREALTVAMALVPGLYARNRFFSLFREPEVKRAKTRAAMIRGVVRQLAGAHGAAEGLAFVRHGDLCVLRYRVPSIRLERRVEMTETERACLVYLASRAGVKHVHASAEDRAHVDAALKRLAATEPIASRAAGELALASVDARPHASEFPAGE
jgi:hypothetical protein